MLHRQPTHPRAQSLRQTSELLYRESITAAMTTDQDPHTLCLELRKTRRHSD